MAQKEILIIGVYHFREENYVDHYSENVQIEIEELMNKLTEFKPDKIAIEAPYLCQQSISLAYKSIVLNDFYMISEMRNTVIGQLEILGNLYPIDYNNEAVQLGFRLGKKMKHKNIFAVDYLIDYKDELVLMNQFNRERTNQAELLEKRKTEFSSILEDQNSFIGKIRAINKENWSSTMNDLFYSSVIRVGAQHNYIGADKMVTWYERNLKILVNLLDLFEDRDKVICFFGAGHLSILKELITKYTDLKIVDSSLYVPQNSQF